MSARATTTRGLGLLMLAFGLSTAACEPAPSASFDKTPVAADEGVGSVSLALMVGGSVRFDSVSYAISGNGFQRAGTVDVSKSTTFSSVVSGIPVGTGYTATLTAQDATHKVTGCQGSATFAVTSGASTPVAIAMTCHEAPASAPPAVPVPRAAAYTLAALLLVFGAARLRRPAAS